jgi:hypothetical protein
MIYFLLILVFIVVIVLVVDYHSKKSCKNKYDVDEYDKKQNGQE